MMQMPTPTTTLSYPSRRPRLAFVLGSGGVRSIAAVGIAEVLEREGVRPDLAVGCSSGALFGATIALGMTPEQALRTATELWSQERPASTVGAAGCNCWRPSSPASMPIFRCATRA